MIGGTIGIRLCPTALRMMLAASRAAAEDRAAQARRIKLIETYLRSRRLLRGGIDVRGIDNLAFGFVDEVLNSSKLG